MKSILYGLFLISFLSCDPSFQHLSYWEVLILSIIFGAFIGGGSSASK